MKIWEIRNGSGIFIKVGCIKTNEKARRKEITTKMERQRWILCAALFCEYLLKILYLYLGSAIQVLKEWNMTGKKKVRLTLAVNYSIFNQSLHGYHFNKAVNFMLLLNMLICLPRKRSDFLTFLNYQPLSFSVSLSHP